jgi:hypothetical protein
LNDSWNRVSTFEVARDLVINNDPVGTYRVFHDGSPFKALNANRSGDLIGASSFKIIDPDLSPLAQQSPVYRLQLAKVQKFIQQTKTMDTTKDDHATGNAQAAQLAIWAALDQLDPSVELAKRARTKVWSDAVARYRAEINKADGSTRDFPPDRLFAQMHAQQTSGLITIDVAVSNVRLTLEDQLITASDPVSAASIRTPSDTGIGKIELPDLLSGRAQSITVRWGGFVPAGTLLQAQYPKSRAKEKEKEDPDKTGYLLTLQPVYVTLEHVQVRGNGSC